MFKKLMQIKFIKLGFHETFTWVSEALRDRKIFDKHNTFQLGFFERFAEFCECAFISMFLLKILNSSLIFKEKDFNCMENFSR